MQSNMTDSASASASVSVVASSSIRIDGVLVLTGMLSLGFLLVSWILAITGVASVAAGAYFAITERTIDGVFAAVGEIVAAIITALSWITMRWFARGILEGRKTRAIVACIAMIGLTTLTCIPVVSGNLTLAMASTVGTEALMGLVLSFLLIASFRNRLYWGRTR
jgi:hypothetical protein